MVKSRGDRPASDSFAGAELSERFAVCYTPAQPVRRALQHGPNPLAPRPISHHAEVVGCPREDSLIDRRTFLAGTGAVILAAPLATEAQQPGKVYRIGLLDYSAPDPARQAWWNAFRQQMRELGYVEGQNVRFEQRGPRANTTDFQSLPPGSSASRWTLSSREGPIPP